MQNLCLQISDGSGFVLFVYEQNNSSNSNNGFWPHMLSF